MLMQTNWSPQFRKVIATCFSYYQFLRGTGKAMRTKSYSQKAVIASKKCNCRHVARLKINIWGMENTLLKPMRHHIWNLVNIDIDTVASAFPSPAKGLARMCMQHTQKSVIVQTLDAQSTVCCLPQRHWSGPGAHGLLVITDMQGAGPPDDQRQLLRVWTSGSPALVSLSFGTRWPG